MGPTPSRKGSRGTGKPKSASSRGKGRGTARGGGETRSRRARSNKTKSTKPGDDDDDCRSWEVYDYETKKCLPWTELVAACEDDENAWTDPSTKEVFCVPDGECVACKNYCIDCGACVECHQFPMNKHPADFEEYVRFRRDLFETQYRRLLEKKGPRL